MILNNRGGQLDFIIRNAPIPVNFAGLRGNTRTMQDMGWQLALECFANHLNISYDIRIAGKHPGMGLQVLSYPTRFFKPQFTMEMVPEMEFNLHLCAEQISIRSAEMPKFKSIDFSKPQAIPSSDLAMDKHFTLEECCIFKPYNDEADIYVPEKKIWTIMEHLKGIKDLQYDKQKELREKAREKRARQYSKEGREMTSPNQINENEEVKLQLVAV